jgi:hypothetical protein
VVPAIGQAVAIGVNTADSIRPAAYSSYSQNWAYSLFNSYGTGTFVPDYSPAGAFVIAGSGGHNSPANVDAAIFDFTDARWKLVGKRERNPRATVGLHSWRDKQLVVLELLGATAGRRPLHTCTRA